MRQRPISTISRCPGAQFPVEIAGKKHCQVGKKKRNTNNWLYIIRLSHAKISWKVADPLFDPARLDNRQGKLHVECPPGAGISLFRGKAYAAPDLFHRNSGARPPPNSAAASTGRGDELTTNVYETYYACVQNLLRMCAQLTTKAGPGQLRTQHNQAENPAFSTGKGAAPLPLRTLPDDPRAPGLLTRK